jgi:hypothetical protein
MVQNWYILGAMSRKDLGMPVQGARHVVVYLHHRFEFDRNKGSLKSTLCQFRIRIKSCVRGLTASLLLDK